MLNLEIGEMVTYHPDRVYELTIVGYVREKIISTSGCVGYKVQCGRVVHVLWSNRGVFVSTGRKVATERPAHPYVCPADLINLYKNCGMGCDEGWSQYLKDTILSPRFSSDAIDVKQFAEVWKRCGFSRFA